MGYVHHMVYEYSLNIITGIDYYGSMFSDDIDVRKIQL